MSADVPQASIERPARGSADRLAIPILVSIAMGAASGLMLAAALRPLAWWPLAFIGLIPMILAQYRVLPRRWCWVPVVTAVFVFAFLSTGILYTQHAAWFAFGAPAIWAAIAGGFAIVDRSLNERQGLRWFIVLMPVLWVGLDSLRVYLVLTGTDGYLAYALYEHPAVIATVSVMGIGALSLLILVINYALALPLVRGRAVSRRWQASRPSLRTVVTSGVIALTVVLAWFAFGVASVRHTLATSGPTVRVAAIQPGTANMPVGLGGPPSAGQIAAMQAELSEMTRTAARQGAQLVVWPEEVIGFNPQTAPPSQSAWLLDLVRETGVTLVTGYIANLPDGSYTNAAALISPQGTVLGHYTKAHQAPFDDDLFQTGDTYSSYPTPIGTIGMMICFDEEFPDTARFITLSGANIIAVPAWQFKELASIQEYDKLVLRAAEDRVPIVSADMAWDSAIIDATGSVLASTDDVTTDGSSALLISDVALGPRDGPFLLMGNWVGMLCAGAGLVLIVVAIMVRAAARRPSWVRPTDGE